MRVYISGPMTGKPDNNRAAFGAAATRLRDLGHFVINPAELGAMFGSEDEIAESFKIFYCIDGGTDFVLEYTFRKRASLAECIMQADLTAVRSCDAIYLLRGWEQSRGAKKELAEAIAHGLTIMQGGEVKC